MSALIADSLLGVMLVARHRAFVLGLLLAGALLAVAATAGDPGVVRRTLFVVVGTLGALAGTQLTGPAAAHFALRRSAAPWWIPPVGRLLGGLTVTCPVVAIGLVVLLRAGLQPAALVQSALLALLYLGAWMAVVAGAAPLIGEAAAGTLSVLLVWVGGITPSGVQQLLAGAPYLQRPAVLAWNVLPLGWRAERATAGGATDPLLLGAWVVVGLLVAAWGCDWVVVRDPAGATRR
jgi:hypothetical protein